MHAGSAHGRHVGAVADARFGDHRLARRHCREQIERGLQAHFESTQAAVVDAEQGRAQWQGALELGAVVHLDQHIQAQVDGDRFQFQHLRIRQGGDDEQDCVGTDRARFDHLVGIDDEIFAQGRQIAGGARLRQILRGTLEKLAVGEHAQAGRAMGRITLRNDGRLEMLAQDAFGRRGFFDLGDDRRLATRDAADHLGGESTRRGLATNLIVELVQAVLGAAGRHFGAFNGDDLFEYVLHDALRGVTRRFARGLRRMSRFC